MLRGRREPEKLLEISGDEVKYNFDGTWKVTSLGYDFETEEELRCFYDDNGKIHYLDEFK